MEQIKPVKSPKNSAISVALKATRNKRKSQICKGFELKIVKAHNRKKTNEQLKLQFLESKWLYNYVLSQPDVFKVSDKLKSVPVLMRKLSIGNDEEEPTEYGMYVERKLDNLGSQVKQSIIKRLHQNIYNLAKAKAKGIKVGALNFITRMDSIPLKQHGVTFQIYGNNIKIQGIKKWMRIRGAEQLKDWEIANARLIQKAGDFYLHVTCYMDKKLFIAKKEEKNKNKPDIKKLFSIAPDFGILNQVTLSNGIQLNYQVPHDKRHRKACQDLSRKEYGSKNYAKSLIKLQKKYVKYNNKKHDIKKKIFHIMQDESEYIIFQNDCMQGWQHLWGKRMLYTAIGGIISDLRKSETAIEVDRFFASTQQCRTCKNKQKVMLDERVFVCESCGHTESRDVHSARSIEAEGLKKIGVEYTELKPVETSSSTLRMLDRFNSIPCLKASLVVESGSHLALASA